MGFRETSSFTSQGSSLKDFDSLVPKDKPAADGADRADGKTIRGTLQGRLDSLRRRRKENIREAKKSRPIASEGKYGEGSDTFGRYQNVSNAAHMLTHLVRLSSGRTHTVDWQLNLRGGTGRKPEEGWRRHFTKPQASFDVAQERCSKGATGKEAEAYQNQPGTPLDRSFDRNRGAIKTATQRDFPASFQRAPGCEGAQVGMWRHLLAEPQVTRQTMEYATTLREQKKGEDAGVRINDNRSDTCWVEMMGKKDWESSRSNNPRAWHPAEGGDVRLHHLNYLKAEAVADEDARKQRTTKEPRRDVKTPRARASPRAP
eukprot:TRINITY_DN32947_c0_g1_i1.p1 TRINITY_DN32947_c0_g1~~TRINITY_DN32947_c0_g1_i1.p1  ORF type:complete len:316 (+),score=58.22 TRINITY_DN32947_c0_g1_i1:83-1030(+)